MIVRVEGFIGPRLFAKAAAYADIIIQTVTTSFNPRRELQAYAKVVSQDNTILAGEIQRMRLQYRKKSKSSTSVQKEKSKSRPENSSDVD
jgi:hypothetical protein